MEGTNDLLLIDIIISFLLLYRRTKAPTACCRRSDLRLISQGALNYAVPRQRDNLGTEIVDYHGRISGYVPRPNFPYEFRYILPQNPRNTAVGGFRKFIVVGKTDLSITLITFVVYDDRIQFHECVIIILISNCLQVDVFIDI